MSDLNGRQCLLGCVLSLAACWQATSLAAAGPEPIPLWPDGAPGAVGEEDQDRPELLCYPAAEEDATGAAIVVCPGGGYGVLAMDHEGHQVALWLNSIGVSAYVVKYRLGPRYHHPAPLQDAQRAIRHVRAHADRWHVSPDRIGIMGFSAGGHLASTAATHFDEGEPDSDDAVQRVSCRPDFAVLAYPVISLQAEFAHAGSRRNLLGDDPDPELVASLSNETQVTEQTPPVFLFHTTEDAGVPVENALAFYAACRKAGVPAELHVYQFGPHGVGLAPGDPVAGTWKERLADWLKASGFLSDGERAAVEGTVRLGRDPLRWGMITFVPNDKHQPVAFAMISGGKFRIPAERGAAVGICQVQIRDLGSVEPQPTIDAVRYAEQGNFSYAVVPEANTMVVEVAVE